jgi:hypothetical protein
MDHSLSLSYALCYQALSANVFFVCIIQGRRMLDAVAVTAARILILQLKSVLFPLTLRFVYELQLFTEITLHRTCRRPDKNACITFYDRTMKKTPWF